MFSGSRKRKNFLEMGQDCGSMPPRESACMILNQRTSARPFNKDLKCLKTFRQRQIKARDLWAMYHIRTTKYVYNENNIWLEFGIFQERI